MIILPHLIQIKSISTTKILSTLYLRHFFLKIKLILYSLNAVPEKPHHGYLFNEIFVWYSYWRLEFSLLNYLSASTKHIQALYFYYFSFWNSLWISGHSAILQFSQNYFLACSPWRFIVINCGRIVYFLDHYGISTTTVCQLFLPDFQLLLYRPYMELFGYCGILIIIILFFWFKSSQHSDYDIGNIRQISFLLWHSYIFLAF